MSCTKRIRRGTMALALGFSLTVAAATMTTTPVHAKPASIQLVEDDKDPDPIGDTLDYLRWLLNVLLS